MHAMRRVKSKNEGKNRDSSKKFLQLFCLCADHLRFTSSTLALSCLIPCGARFMCLEFSHVAVEPLQQLYDWYSFNVIPSIGEVTVYVSCSSMLTTEFFLFFHFARSAWRRQVGSSKMPSPILYDALLCPIKLSPVKLRPTFFARACPSKPPRRVALLTQ